MKIAHLVFLLLVSVQIFTPSCRNSSEKAVKSEAAETVDYVRSQSSSVPFNAIHKAALEGNLPMVKDLAVSGTGVNTLDAEERTALIYASYNGHTEVMKYLLDAGALVNVADIYGRTALMMASSGPFPEAVKLLLEKKAEVNSSDREEHFTALMFAASEGQLEIVKTLLDHGADPFRKDVDGDDALTFARNNGHSQVVSFLEKLSR